MRNKYIYHFLCIIASIIFIIPLVLTISNSFMLGGEITANYFRSRANDGEFLYFRLIPQKFTLEQYVSILLNTPEYLKLFWNSVSYIIPIVIGNIVVSYMTAYALFRLNSKLADFILILYTVVMLMPYQVICVPNFMILNSMDLLDTRLALILPAVFNPFGTFLLRQFFTFIPDEYIESSQICGANELQICFYMIFPLIKRGISALAIITFVEYWNMVEQPLIFLQTSGKEPLSLFLSVMVQDNAGMIFAASTFYMIPAVLFFLYYKDEFIQGIQLSSGLK